MISMRCFCSSKAKKETKHNKQKASSDQLSSRGGEQSSSGADDDDVIDEAVREADRLRREAAAPQRRAIQFGKWTISPIYSNTASGPVQTGWGSNCGCHFGSHLVCKKSFTATTAEGLAEARCLAKAWLLAGLPISAASQIGRNVHVLGPEYQRDTLVVEDEATMDARASAT